MHSMMVVGHVRVGWFVCERWWVIVDIWGLLQCVCVCVCMCKGVYVTNQGSQEGSEYGVSLSPND